jgi:hypothetical protein
MTPLFFGLILLVAAAASGHPGNLGAALRRLRLMIRWSGVRLLSRCENDRGAMYLRLPRTGLRCGRRRLRCKDVAACKQTGCNNDDPGAHDGSSIEPHVNNSIILSAWLR